MPLKIDQVPIGRALIGIPGMMCANRFVFATIVFQTNQPIVLKIIDHLQLCDRDQRLPAEQHNPEGTADPKGKGHCDALQGGILPKWIGQISRSFARFTEPFAFRPQCRPERPRQHAKEKGPKTFVVFRRNSVFRSANECVVYQ